MSMDHARRKTPVPPATEQTDAPTDPTDEDIGPMAERIREEWRLAEIRRRALRFSVTEMFWLQRQPPLNWK
jgi:hypothetical protein